jgi:membrane-associated phospholipid phosphatase
MLSLEVVLVLPVVALIVLGLIQVAALGRDLLVLHEAARVGARVAATTSGSSAPERAVRAAAWAGAALLPAVTGYFRMRAGKHFLSDVAVGYVAGAAIGLSIPLLHRSQVLH